MHQINGLQDVEFCVSSQFGEDGIIDWLVEKAEIPRPVQCFVEFGVENYQEANTRFLLQNRNWRGLILDGNPKLAEGLKRDPLFWRHDLTVESSFITRENINNLISDASFAGDIGLLSVDIDGNDYWVWQAIEVVRPIIVICEFNAVFGNIHAISVPYDPQFVRNHKHPSYLYFGASLPALCSLSAKKGYSFVGTTLAGNDAFFVRNDHAPKVLNAMKKVAAYCSRTREARDETGALIYTSGKARFDLIAGLPVVQVETGNVVNLKDLHPIATPDWS
jgi:hypothetical protein